MFADVQQETQTQTATQQVENVDGNKFIKDAKVANDINSPTSYWRRFNMKRFWIIFGVTAGIFVLLLILSCTVDFKISWGLASQKFLNQYESGGKSQATYFSNNAWDNLIESFGDAPGFLICMFGLWLMAFGFFKIEKGKLTWWRRTCQIIVPSFLILTAIWTMWDYNYWLGFHDYLKIVGGSTSNEVNTFVAFLFSFVFNGLADVLITKFRPATRVSLVKLGVLFVFAFICSELFVWLLKYDAGLNRERFRAIMIDPNNWTETSAGSGVWEIDYSKAHDAFHPWWSKTPIWVKDAWTARVSSIGVSSYASNAFSSFPSGHSSLATCSMALCFLPCCYDKAGNKVWKGYVIWLVCLAITLTVMFSRVGAGAHYLSDTTIGFFFGIVPIFALGMVMFKIPQVSDFFQGLNVNGQWYQMTFIPLILPAMVWIVTKALSWA